MSWAETLLDASFRGVPFDAVKTSDSAQRALAAHEYPYVDGADIEDLGRGPRALSIEAIFFGDNYEAQLQRFLQALDEPGPGELIHPVFGLVKHAQLRHYSIHHQAEDVDQATVQMEFVESTPAEPFFSRALAITTVGAIALKLATARELAAAQAAATVDATRRAHPLSGLDALRRAMTGPVLALLAQVKTTLSGLDVLAYPRAWANDLSSLVNEVLDLRDFALDLQAEWQGIVGTLSLLDLFDGTKGIAGDPNTTPPAPLAAAGEIAPVSQAQAIYACAIYVATAGALGKADAAGLVFAAEADTPTLSPPQIEAIASAARSDIEDAILMTRALYPLETSRALIEALKDAALAVQLAAKAIILARPPLVVLRAPVTGNLRLIAHVLYGDHTRASELWRLNDRLRWPNRIAKGDRLNAYWLGVGEEITEPVGGGPHPLDVGADGGLLTGFASLVPGSASGGATAAGTTLTGSASLSPGTGSGGSGGGGGGSGTGAWNPADALNPSAITFSDSDHTAVVTDAAALACVRATAGRSSGTRYFELLIIGVDHNIADVFNIGCCTPDSVMGDMTTATAPGVVAFLYQPWGKQKSTGAGGTSGSIYHYYDAGDVLGVLVKWGAGADANSVDVWIRQNGGWYTGHNPTLGEPAQIHLIDHANATITLMPYVNGGEYDAGSGATINLGSSAFAHTLPSGGSAAGAVAWGS